MLFSCCQNLFERFEIADIIIFMVFFLEFECQRLPYDFIVYVRESGVGLLANDIVDGVLAFQVVLVQSSPASNLGIR
ncbi:hypothetical protein D3C86_1594750 [compost metagenome]